MNSFCTYLHKRPNGTTFYVGKGYFKRAHELHHGRNSYHANIVAKYGKENIIVHILADKLLEHAAFFLEVSTINLLKKNGTILANMTDGGEGASGCTRSAETRAKLSAQKKGKKHSVEHRLKVSAARKGVKTWRGYKHSDESKAKISAAKLGKPIGRPGKKLSTEHRAKLSESHKGHIHSDEHKAKISAANKLRWENMSDEQRTKIMAVHKGKQVSVETREKTSAALRLYHLEKRKHETDN